MTARKKGTQSPSPHDRKVKKVQDAAKGRGNKDVRAHLPGQRQPPKLGGRIPDVSWKRPDGKRVVREIDPPVALPGATGSRGVTPRWGFLDFHSGFVGSDFLEVSGLGLGSGSEIDFSEPFNFLTSASNQHALHP